MELGAGPAIIDNIIPQQIKSLYLLVEEMKTQTISRRKFLDIEFHSIFLGVCNNRILDSLKPLIIDYFAKFKLNKAATTKTVAKVYQEHFDIVKALEKSDYDLLQQAIQEHYQGVC